jgi:hypothetical protein
MSTVQVIDTADPESDAEPTIVAALEGRGDLSLWKPLRFGVDRRRLHLFDRESGRTLAR